ncbi:phosphatidylethanolamine-binding protein [Blastocladiella britannica]|nr:phosphatidylethanolamine-binding protein [Blastocladiella britannica]
MLSLPRAAAARASSLSSSSLLLVRRTMAKVATKETAAHPAFAEALKTLEAHDAVLPHTNIDTVAAFRNGAADFSKPEFRKLGLDHFVGHRRPRVIQFAEQRHIFADFFPKNVDDFTVELHIATAAGERVELGQEVAPSETVSPIQVHVQPYHEDTRLYTFVLVDADKARPDAEVRSEELLWVVKDIPISAASAPAPLPLPTTAAQTTTSTTVGTLVVPYVPPHPTRGSGAHRMAAFVFEQPGEPELSAPAMPVSAIANDDGVRVWDLVRAHAWTPRGVHVWKARWDSSVADVFATYLGAKEPVYVTKPTIGRKGVDGLVADRFANV